MTLKDRIDNLQSRTEKVSKYNPCHNASDGQFCSTGAGRGVKDKGSTSSRALNVIRSNRRMRVLSTSQLAYDLGVPLKEARGVLKDMEAKGLIRQTKSTLGFKSWEPV